MKIQKILGESERKKEPWMFQTREEIQGWIDYNRIEGWVDDNLEVQGIGSVVITTGSAIYLEKPLPGAAIGWYIPVQFDGSIRDFSVNVDLKSFKGLPRHCAMALRVDECRTESLIGLPEKVNVLNLRKCNGITSMSGIDKIVNTCEHIVVPGTIIESILGLLKIKDLSWVAHGPEVSNTGKLHSALEIINNHLDNGKDLISCKRELISSGLKEFAKL